MWHIGNTKLAARVPHQARLPAAVSAVTAEHTRCSCFRPGCLLLRICCPAAVLRHALPLPKHEVDRLAGEAVRHAVCKVVILKAANARSQGGRRAAASAL